MLGGIPFDVLKIPGRRSHRISLVHDQYSTTATEIATPSLATVILLLCQVLLQDNGCFCKTNDDSLFTDN